MEGCMEEPTATLLALINGFLNHLEIFCNWVGMKDLLHGCKLTFFLGGSPSSPTSSGSETSSEFRGLLRFLKGDQSSLSSQSPPSPPLLLFLLLLPLPPLLLPLSFSFFLFVSPFSSLPFFLPFSSLCSFFLHPSAGENEQKRVCEPSV